MHELSVTVGLLELVKDAIKGEDKKVKKINVVVGDLSGIDHKCVDFYFDIISQNTLAHGAILKFTEEKSKFQCKDCQQIYQREDFYFNCPHCGGRGNIVKSCISLYVESIEVE